MAAAATGAETGTVTGAECGSASTSSYRLTRYLYSVDEVKYCLITALLKKKDIDECYYWCFELYFSQLEEELFELFYKIHYDFYAERNPKLEGYIKTKKTKWLFDKKIIHIASIIKNMFIADSTPTVFLMRQYIAAFGVPSHIYKNTNHIMCGNMINFSADYKNLCSAISYGRLANIAYDINFLTERDGADVVHKVIIDYFETEFGGIYEEGREKINKIWKNREFKSDDIHVLLAIVVHLMADIEQIKTRPLFAIPAQDIITDLLHFDSEIIQPVYDTLCHKRKYKINNVIGAFELDRDGLPDFLNDNWLHWEYYATGVPLWENRLSGYDGMVNHNKRELWFPDDDDSKPSSDADNDTIEAYYNDRREKFYKLYGYELDEQPKNTQYLSLYQIDPLSWKIWICDVFGLKDDGNKCVNVNGIVDMNLDLLADQMSDMNIAGLDIKEITMQGNPYIYKELDIDSILKNMPVDFRFIY